MVRLREQDTGNRGLLILHAAFRGQCAYHSPPLRSDHVRTP
jgi:hypothetical protein